MGKTVDPGGFDVKIVTVFNDKTVELFNDFSNYSSKLAAIPSYWQGTDAKNAVDVLAENYTDLKNVVEQFIKDLNTDCSDIVADVNNYLKNNGGEGNLSFKSFEENKIVSLDIPTVDVSKTHSDDVKLNEIVSNIQTYSNNIISYFAEVNVLFKQLSEENDFFYCEHSIALSEAIDSCITKLSGEIETIKNDFVNDFNIIIENYKKL